MGARHTWHGQNLYWPFLRTEMRTTAAITALFSTWFRLSGFKLDFWVLGFRFCDLGFGFRVSGFGVADSGFGSRMSGAGRRVSGFGFKISGFGFWVSGFGFRLLGVGLRVSGFDLRGCGLRFSGFGLEPSHRACWRASARPSPRSMRGGTPARHESMRTRSHVATP